MAASHVYVRARALGCFHSLISTETFRRALAASPAGQLRGDKECPFSGVTKSGRVWRKVPESDARSVGKPVSCHVVGLLDDCAATMQIRISLDHNDQTPQVFMDTDSACRKSTRQDSKESDTGHECFAVLMLPEEQDQRDRG